jgi:vancomycin resistance protein VanJ
MTYNPHGYNYNVERVVWVIRSEQPDVVAIQELSTWLADALVAQLGHEYPYHDLYPRAGVEGIGLISRFPLDRQRLVPLDSWNSWAQEARVLQPGRSTTVFNLHAQPVLMEGPTWRVKMITFEVSFRMRELQARQLVEYARERDGPIVLAGDFNQGEHNSATAVLERTYTDSYLQAGSGFGFTFPSAAAPTSLGIAPWIPPLFRLDRLYHNDHLRAASARVAAGDGYSDHYPVVATFVDAP